MIPGKQTMTVQGIAPTSPAPVSTVIKAKEVEAAEGVKVVVAKGTGVTAGTKPLCPVAKTAIKTKEIEAAKGANVVAQGNVVNGVQATKPVAKTTMKVAEVEAAEGAKAVAAKGTAVKGTTAKALTLKGGGNATLVGANATLATKPAAKGVLAVATKSATATGIGLSSLGPVLVAGILIASGTGIYYYLKNRSLKGELEEIST